MALKCFHLRRPGDGSTLLQKSHHNSLVLIICDIVIFCDIVIICENITNVVLIGSWDVFSSLSQALLYVIILRHASYAKSSNKYCIHTQVRQPKVTQTLLWRKRQINFFGGRGVVIVRNPYRALISYWNHQVLT